MVKTPNLDSLASEGLLFKNHFAQCTPCGPSRASLYTGMYLQNHRSIHNGTPLDARHSNIAIEMRKLGYEPVLAGYTDATADPRRYPVNDPALKTYGGFLPGFGRVLAMPSTSFPQPWGHAPGVGDQFQTIRFSGSLKEKCEKLWTLPQSG